MVTAIIVTYLVASLAIPMIWDRQHRQYRAQRQASRTGSMRVRGSSR